MRHTGRYCYTEDPYDLEHIINEAVDKTKELTKELTNMAKNEKDAKAILLAIMQTQLEELAKI